MLFVKAKLTICTSLHSNFANSRLCRTAQHLHLRFDLKIQVLGSCSHIWLLLFTFVRHVVLSRSLALGCSVCAKAINKCRRCKKALAGNCMDSSVSVNSNVVRQVLRPRLDCHSIHIIQRPYVLSMPT